MHKEQAGSCIGCEAFLEVKIGQLRSRLVKIFQDRYKIGTNKVKIIQNNSREIKKGQLRSR